MKHKMILASAAAALLANAAFSGGAFAQEKSVTIASWGGSYQDGCHGQGRNLWRHV